jgi:hypothetical protein
MKVTALRTAILAALPLFCLSAVAAEGPLAQKKGQGGSEIQGSAGPGGSQADNGLEHCDKPMGAMAVVEPQDYVAQSLSHYGLQSPTGLIRMMVQQSNCFIVVERGLGMQNMMQERALQARASWWQTKTPAGPRAFPPLAGRGPGDALERAAKAKARNRPRPGGNPSAPLGGGGTVDRSGASPPGGDPGGSERKIRVRARSLGPERRSRSRASRSRNSRPPTRA